MEQLTSNRYQIITVLGQGGMGRAYKAIDHDLGRIVAIKVLLPKYLSDPKVVQRFQREAKTAAKLEHPGIVQVIGSGVSENGQPYLVMEFIEGETLADWLANKGQMPLDLALELFIQLCDALTYAHSRGVLHRDIKPSNIMIERQAEQGATVKLLDFGIAKVMEERDPAAQRLTDTGVLIGSPLYMSPEQGRGAKLDVRSDLYSVGCTLYETLTGGAPHLGQNAIATLLKREKEKPVTLNEASMGVGFPEQVEAIVSRLLSADPSQRYRSAEALKADLLKAKAGQMVEMTPIKVDKVQIAVKDTLPERRRDLWVLAIAIICVGVLAFLGSDRHDKKRLIDAGSGTTGSIPAPPNEVPLIENARIESDLIKAAPEPSVFLGLRNPEIDEQLERPESLISIGEYGKANAIIGQMYTVESKKSKADQERDAMQILLLANKHFIAGEHAAAQPYYFLAQAILNKIAPASEDMAKIKTGIARNYAALRDFQKSEPYAQEAIAIRLKLFGANSFEYASSQEHLAEIIMQERSDNQLVWSRVSPLYDQVISIDEKRLGKRNVRLAQLLVGQASVCISRGLLTEAQTRLERANRIYRLAEPQNGTDAVFAMLKLAQVYDLQNKHSQAESLDLSAKSILEKIPNPDETFLATADYYMADHYRCMASSANKELYKTINKLYTRAIDVFEAHKELCHEELAYVLQKSGDNCCDAAPLGNPELWNEAESFYKRALKIYQQCPPKYSDQIADINTQLSRVEKAKRNL